MEGSCEITLAVFGMGVGREVYRRVRLWREVVEIGAVLELGCMRSCKYS